MLAISFVFTYTLDEAYCSAKAYPLFIQFFAFFSQYAKGKDADLMRRRMFIHIYTNPFFHRF